MTKRPPSLKVGVLKTTSREGTTMIVVWFAFSCLSEYLETWRRGRLGRPKPPERCVDGKCRARKCYWRHGSYERAVAEASLAAQIRVERFKCKECGKTISMLPAFVVRRRRYTNGLISERVEGYAISKTSYRREANGPGRVPCSSSSQVWRWVDLLSERARGLLIEVQGACTLGQPEEEALIDADGAQCPNAGAARSSGKAAQLNDLAKLVSFGRLATEGGRGSVLERLGTFFQQKVQVVQQIFAVEAGGEDTPQRAAPLTA